MITTLPHSSHLSHTAPLPEPIVGAGHYLDLLLLASRLVEVLETEEDNPKFIHSEAKNLLLLLPLLLVAAPPSARPGN